MFETMHAVNGAGLAAPQIGVNLRLVIFGFGSNNRYPEAPPVPETVLINPQLTPLGEQMEDGWEGCLSVPGMRGLVPRFARLRYEGFDQHGKPIRREVDGFHARVVQHEVRSPGRHPVPDAHQGLEPVRIHRRIVPGRRRHSR